MIVYGEGRPESKIWLVGEAPGTNEEQCGRPFVGGAGMILNGMLNDAGINRNECYVDNVMQERPPNNDFDKFYLDGKKRKAPSQGLLDRYEILKNQIGQYKPNVVVALGNEALKALTGKTGVTDWRGSILNCNGVKVIPIIHPAAVMRLYEFRPVSVMDLQRVRKESTTPDFPPPYNDNFIINPSYEVVVQYLTKVLPLKEYISFDIETYHLGEDPLTKQIECLGLGWSKEDAICIPIFYGNKSWYTIDEELKIIKLVQELFANPNIKFIAQNAQFDMIYLRDKWNVHVANLWMDTMIAFHCLYPEFKKGLDFINSVYTTRPYYKGETGGTGDIRWHYNCLDAVVTWECAMQIDTEMKEYGVEEFYRKIPHALIVPLMEIQRTGVKIDVELRKKVNDNLEADVLALQSRLEKAVGHELNVASPKQMKEFLYNELKLPVQINRGKANPTADANAIEKLMKKFNNPALTIILEIRKVRKLLSTYIQAPLDKDNRLRCSYLISGTETGRLSSRENVYGTGTNLQNIPRGELVRSMFIPDEGKMFVNADLSQAEARVVAYIASEERLQKVFESGGDIHKKNAAMIFAKRVEEVTDDERQIAKTLVHAANYGTGPRKFAEIVECTQERAAYLLNQYYNLYPCIKIWHKKIEETLRKKRILITPFGRKRMFFGRFDDELIREGIAYIPQSTVGDLLNYGIVRCWNNLPDGWNILLQNHDAVLVQVPKHTDHLMIYKFFKYYFEIPIEMNYKQVIIPIDIKIGKNWGVMDKLCLPEHVKAHG